MKMKNDPRTNPNHGRSMEDQEFWNEASGDKLRGRWKHGVKIFSGRLLSWRYTLWKLEVDLCKIESWL